MERNDDALWGRRQLLRAAGGVGVAAVGFVPQDTIAAPVRANKKKVSVRGLDMAYYEVGQGRPIVFLHGNPTSSYQWRNIIPYVESLGRCIAPDMIGMGDSEPLPNSGPGVYIYPTHRDYMFELFEKLGISDDVIFVVHDWGSAMGFEWAYHHPDRIRGIAYYEAMVRPPDTPRPVPAGGPFVVYRSAAGEKAVLEDNMFVENMLRGLRYYLSDEEMAEYRRPFLQPGESRRPTLEWPRELPLGGNPKRNDDIWKEYSAWLAQDTRIPKLFWRGDPGGIFAFEPMLRFVQGFKNQTEVTIYGTHHLQDIAPDAMGRALAEWIRNLA
jgi:haloalkane dehalogenase